MPPGIALFLWFVLLIALFRYDPAKDTDNSRALWLPVIWLFLLASRLPSQWLGASTGGAAGVYLEGSPVDRIVFLALAAMALAVLLSRSFRWGDFIARNIGLVAFLCIALLSVTWSDYPFVSLKRWVRDVGGYLTLMVVLTERNVFGAVATVLRRLAYLLVPLSIVFVKYFPELGRSYEAWTGATVYQGVATSKNMLGVLCLVSALYFFWDLRTRLPHRKDKATRRVILVDVAFLAMTAWLLNVTNSATSSLCVVLGIATIAAAESDWSKRHRAVFRLAAPALIFAYLVLESTAGVNNVIAEAVGRDPTLTDRTDIWTLVLSMGTNPIVGTGYESFWLGPRLDAVWATYAGLNQAHNGYIETYLNLGLLGLIPLIAWLFANYGKICSALNESSTFASLSLAVWTILLFYNITEAAFKAQPLWAVFLLMMFVTTTARITAARPTEVRMRSGPQHQLSSRWRVSRTLSRLSVGPSRKHRDGATWSPPRFVVSSNGHGQPAANGHGPPTARRSTTQMPPDRRDRPRFGSRRPAHETDEGYRQTSDEERPPIMPRRRFRRHT